MWSKILILSVVVGVCIAGTVTVVKPPEEKLVPAAVVDDLNTAETNVGRQFGHGGYGSYPSFGFGGYGGGLAVGGFGGYGGYGGSWGGHHSHGGYGGYGHYPHGGGYGHYHG